MIRHIVRVFLIANLLGSSQSTNPLENAMNNRRCILQGIKVDVKLVNCYPRQVEINTCLGVCISTVTPIAVDNSLEPRCDCCKVESQQKLEVEMKCVGSNGEYSHYHPMYTAKTCYCGFCY